MERTHDIFEKLPDGDLISRVAQLRVPGKSPNEFRLMHVSHEYRNRYD